MEDFTRKSYLEGGPTYEQTKMLYDCFVERNNENLKFQALLHGYDLDSQESSGSTKKQSKTTNWDEVERKQSLPVFRDPSEYEEMSQEEKETLTKDMMKKHKTWASQRKEHRW